MGSRPGHQFYFIEKRRLPCSTEAQAYRDEIALRRERNKPETLLSLGCQMNAMDAFFEGLKRHYIDCVASDDISKWRVAAISAIELLSLPHGIERISPSSPVKEG